VTVGAALAAKRTVKTAAELAETLLERRPPAVERRLSPRERRVELAAAGAFILVSAAMGLTAAPEPAGSATLLVLSYALVRRVRFQLGPGLIRPTQIVFVPMLFLTPAAAVPLLVTLGGVLGELPDLLRRRAHPERLAVVIADGWYAVAPALVVALLDQELTLVVLAAALGAQFACDLGVSSAREYLGARILPSELVPVLALVYLMDATLAPVGFLAALASQTHGEAFLLAIAPAALLGLIARERSERIKRELTLERAFRRSTRALDARADDLRRQIERGDAEPEDRARLERVLLATTVEALQADGGRLSEIDAHGTLRTRLALGEPTPALGAAEIALGSPRGDALAIGVGSGHVLALTRAGAPFSPVERDLLEHLAAQAAVTLQNLRLEELMRRRTDELADIAHTLQQSLLPPELPVIPGVEAAALYRPAGEGEVGGDFYDLFPLAPGQWFAVMGDVCGKGAEAAAVTALARYTIRAAAVHHRSPAHVLRALNDAMLRQHAGRFVTLACARIEVGDAVTVTVACGGHPPPRVLRATGLVETLGEPGTIVGLLPTVTACDRSARLAPGDALVLYTDGLTEARAPRVMTPDELDAAVGGARRRDARGIAEHLSEALPDPLRDDLALLVLRAQPLE
jgi:serine phosphatase RsbU (regulator of sigma subunit)